MLGADLNAKKETRKEEVTMRVSTNLLTCGVCVLLAVALGCATIRYTQPPRTATEQFLMSYAAIEAVQNMDMSPLKGHTVFVDETYFESFDKQFVIGQIRRNILATGAAIAARKEGADVIVEIRSAGLGIDQKDVLLGIPSLSIPMPPMGALPIPEFAILKQVKQTGLSGVSLTAYNKETRKIIYSVGPSIGKSKKTDWSILGVTLSTKKNLP
jgi:hypothetical protein